MTGQRLRLTPKGWPCPTYFVDLSADRCPSSADISGIPPSRSKAEPIWAGDTTFGFQAATTRASLHIADRGGVAAQRTQQPDRLLRVPKLRADRFPERGQRSVASRRPLVSPGVLRVIALVASQDTLPSIGWSRSPTDFVPECSTC